METAQINNCQDAKRFVEEKPIIIDVDTESHLIDNSCARDIPVAGLFVQDKPKPQTNVDSIKIIDVSTAKEENEPIDLTFAKTPGENICLRAPLGFLNETNHSQVRMYYQRGPKRKYDSTPDNFLFHENQSQLKLVRSSYPPYRYTAVVSPEHRQQEVLKMAKSVFSKRTRTLYHWMYPTASKQQIKQVVSSTWDSLSPEEKNVYVAQVAGRFGYSQNNLMVNPQLGHIKELPPLPGLEEFNSKAHELQNAISSISTEAGTGANTHKTVVYKESIDSHSTASAIKKGRPRRKKLSGVEFLEVTQGFEDDPELSKELAQFALMLKNKIP